MPKRETGTRTRAAGSARSPRTREKAGAESPATTSAPRRRITREAPARAGGADRRTAAGDLASPATGAPQAAAAGESIAPVIEETTILATGIFMAGSPSLVIGLRYGIGTRGERVVVTGPLTTSPGEVVVEEARATADASITENSIVLTAGPRRSGRPEVGLVFGSVAVGRGVDLEEQIRSPHPPTAPTDGTQPGGSS